MSALSDKKSQISLMSSLLSTNKKGKKQLNIWFYKSLNIFLLLKIIYYIFKSLNYKLQFINYIENGFFKKEI